MWVKGQSGNPYGKLPSKLMRDALMIVLNEEQSDGKGNRFKRLRLVADALVKKATEGDVSAIKEIFDRIDGKVPADVKISSNKQIDGLSFEELAHSIAEALLRLRKITDPTEAHNDQEQRPVTWLSQ